jgi:hypothetical protein
MTETKPAENVTVAKVTTTLNSDRKVLLNTMAQAARGRFRRGR